jgi:hypothetical protein
VVELDLDPFSNWQSDQFDPAERHIVDASDQREGKRYGKQARRRDQAS